MKMNSFLSYNMAWSFLQENNIDAKQGGELHYRLSQLLNSFHEKKILCLSVKHSKTGAKTFLMRAVWRIRTPHFFPYVV